MKKSVILATILLSMVGSGAASASQEAQKLGVCMVDSLNGKERKNLAKWIFLGMSSHSSIAPYSNVTQSDKERSDQYVGTLITRLIADDCPVQAKAASQVNGLIAFEQAFKVVGEVAMQELMNEPAVGNALGAFEQYMDKEKVNSVFK